MKSPDEKRSWRMRNAKSLYGEPISSCIVDPEFDWLEEESVLRRTATRMTSEEYRRRFGKA